MSASKARNAMIIEFSQDVNIDRLAVIILTATSILLMVNIGVVEVNTAPILYYNNNMSMSIDHVNCTDYNGTFVACMPYITTNITSTPSSDCCDGILMLGMQLENSNISMSLRVEVCQCIQLAQHIGNQSDLMPSLPERCGFGLSIPVVNASTNCSMF